MKNAKEKATIYDVAKKANVSLATVSRVLNKSKKVSKKTIDKVNAAIKELDYEPDKFAQALASNKSKTIGIVIPSANYVYISNFINGVIQGAQELDLSITLLTTSHDTAQAEYIVDKLSRERVDGAIIFDDELISSSSEALKKIEFPLVVINQTSDRENVASISLDFVSIMKKIISRKLEQKSHKKLYFLSIKESGKMFKEIEDTFISIHKEYGVPCELLTVPDSYKLNYDWFKNFFKEVKTGFFIGYRDSIAASALNAAHDLGLEIPKEIEVMSIMGTRYSSIIRPSITSLNIDFKKIGYDAVKMLMDLTRDELKEKDVVYKATYKTRHSTKELLEG